MAYPLPTDENLNASAGLQEIFIYANSVTEGGILFKLVLVAIYVIIAMAIVNKSKDDFPMASCVAGFITLIVAILFKLAEIINTLTLSVTIAVFVIGLLFLLFTRDE